MTHKYVMFHPSLPFFANHLKQGKFGILPLCDHTNLTKEAMLSRLLHSLLTSKILRNRQLLAMTINLVQHLFSFNCLEVIKFECLRVFPHTETIYVNVSVKTDYVVPSAFLIRSLISFQSITHARLDFLVDLEISNKIV